MNTPAGYIVSWKVPDSVDVVTLRNGLRAAALDPDLAPDLKPAALVSRTSSYLAKARSGSSAKLLSRPTGYAQRQITLEEHVGDDLQYTREAAIGLEQDGQTLKCDEPNIASILAATAVTIKATRTASDVTRIVQKIVEGAGADLIPVRDQGGAYFIPTGSNVITQVDTVLQAIGGELSRFACTIGHGDGTGSSVANVITDYMLKQIGELKESIDELNEAGIRSDVKSRRLSRVAELRERIGAYATLVNTQGSKLTEALNIAEATLLAKLGPDADDATVPDGDAPRDQAA